MAARDVCHHAAISLFSCLFLCAQAMEEKTEIVLCGSKRIHAVFYCRCSLLAYDSFGEVVFMVHCSFFATDAYADCDRVLAEKGGFSFCRDFPPVLAGQLPIVFHALRRPSRLWNGRKSVWQLIKKHAAIMSNCFFICEKEVLYS